MLFLLASSKTTIAAARSSSSAATTIASNGAAQATTSIGGDGGVSNTRFTPMHSLFTQEDNMIQPQLLESVQGVVRATSSSVVEEQDEFLRTRPLYLGRRSVVEEDEQHRRHAKVKEVLHGVRPDASSKLERVSESELHLLQKDHPELSRQLWGGSGSNSDKLINYADPGDDYDMWQQAYRMLGGFIDCDHAKDQGSGDRNNNNNGGQTKDGACSRWMMWASVSSSPMCFCVV
jgi:hypothetical protein